MTIEVALRKYAAKLGPQHCALQLHHLAAAAGVDDLDAVAKTVDILCDSADPPFRKDAVLYIDDDCYILEGEDLKHLLTEGGAVHPHSGDYMEPGTFDWRWEYAVI